PGSVEASSPRHSRYSGSGGDHGVSVGLGVRRWQEGAWGRYPRGAGAWRVGAPGPRARSAEGLAALPRADLRGTSLRALPLTHVVPRPHASRPQDIGGP